MSKDKNPKPFKFNAYWVYGIVIGLFIVFNFFSGGIGASNGQITTPSKFFKFLKDGDVEKVEIVNKREALVYLTNNASKKEIHKRLIQLHSHGPKPNLVQISSVGFTSSLI